MPERELEGLRREMEKLADHLLAIDGGDVESDIVAAILKKLLDGEMATSIISEYALISEFDDEESGSV